MNIRYNCGDLLSPALEALVEKKVDRLVKKFKIEDAQVDVSMAKEGKEGYALKIQVENGGHNVLAKAVSEDMYKSIDECVAKLDAQLAKHK
ncbi:MAG: ribosome-associated translation inhibitor RaiA [Clostridia bacterium]|nr:ribosome-associated translation inhibitor RaiA [Clostridia bacterium]